MVISDNEKRVDERLKETEQILNEYTKGIGLTAIQYSDEVSKILELTHDQLRATTEEERGIYGYSLARYALFIQKEINRHTAKSKWAAHNLNIIYGKQFNNYGTQYTPAEIKKGMIVAENEYAKALNSILLEASLRVEELSFLSDRIKTMSNILIELQKSRRSEKYERS